MSERIESLISKEALAQFDQLNQKVDASVSSFEKLVAKAIDLNKQLGSATGFKDMNKAATDLTKTEEQLAKAQTDLLAAQERLKKAQDDELKKLTELEKQRTKLNNLYSDEAKKIAELKVQQQEQNKALKEQAQEALGLTDAYKKLEKEYAVAAKEAKNLAVQFGANSKEAKEASARALELDTRLKAADANVGRFNRNVGNYSGALETLKSALQDVSKRIDDNTKSGQANAAVMQSLEREQNLLQSLIDAQSKGFANATSEIRNNQQAILLLSQVYGEDSKVIQELTAKTAELTDTVGDMKAVIKAQASDTHVFDGLIAAAQGLAGIYSVAQGAAALFGDENEELQKTFVKLQAVMSVLQGLQAIQNALQKESAARQLINIGLQKIAVLQTNLQTASESKNIIVKYAAIAAQKALNAAMSLAGGPLLAIIGLLALVVISLSSFSSAAAKASKSIDQLSAEFERDVKALDDYNKSVQRLGDETIADLERNFASEKEIRDQRSKNLREQFRTTFDLERKYAKDIEEQRDKLVDVLKKNTDDLTDEDKKQLDKQDKLLQDYKAIQERRLGLASQIRIGSIQNERETTEESIKARQEEIEAAKLQLQTRQQLQQNITADERKTQQERIAALQESARIQRQLINAGADSQRLTPGLTPSQIKVIEAQRTAALTQARREANKAIEDLNRAYAERERKARFDIVKLEIEDQIKAADLIANNEKNTFDERTDALYAGYEKRRDIIIAQHEFDIKNDTLTAKERISIERKFLSDINGLTVDYGLQQQAIYTDNQNKVNDILEKYGEARRDIVAKNEAISINELNNLRLAGLLGVEEYENKKASIQAKAALESLTEERKLIFAKVLSTKEGTVERAAAEKALAANTLAISQGLLSEEDRISALRIENTNRTVQAISDIYSNMFSFISEGFSIQSDAESARIQSQLDALTKQEEKDKQVVEATITNAQEKAAALNEIEVKSQAKREALEKRQRQLDRQKAQFDKAANIANIITGTALAVVNTLKDPKLIALGLNIPLAATIGALGAAQLARAIAAPLPAFEHGTDDAPGGLSLVGEKRRELVITPDGQVMQTPNVPTVMNVPKHSIVLPDARRALENGLVVNSQGRLVQSENNEIKEVGRKIDTLTKVMRNKPVLNMSANQSGLTAIWNYGASWNSYVEDQTRF